MSFAQFELRLASDGGAAAARGVYQRASGALRQSDEKEERLMLLEVTPPPRTGTHCSRARSQSLTPLLRDFYSRGHWNCFTVGVG